MKATSIRGRVHVEKRENLLQVAIRIFILYFNDIHIYVYIYITFTSNFQLCGKFCSLNIVSEKIIDCI